MNLLATLPAPDAEPIATTQLGDHFQLDQYLRNNLLWTNLARLANEDLVERLVEEGECIRYWRRTPASEQHVQDPRPRAGYNRGSQ